MSFLNSSKRVCSPFDDFGYGYSIPKIHFHINKNELNLNDVVQDTGEILCDKKSDGNERPWKKYKLMSQMLAQKIYPLSLEKDPHCISQNALNSLNQCSDFLIFRNFKTGEKSEVMKLHKAYFCRNRLCPTCNWRKSLKLFSQMQKTSQLLFEKSPKARYLFLTLTVRNVDKNELSSTLDNMNNAFKLLVNKGKTNAVAKGLKSSLLGYAKATEIKYDSEKYITKKMYEQSKNYYTLRGLKVGGLNPNFDMYHPHFHVLLMVKSDYFSRGYITQNEWTSIWKNCLKVDYEPVVDVRTVKPNETKNQTEIFKTQDEMRQASMTSAISETLKYPVKPDSLRLFEFEELDNEIQDKIADAVACLSAVLYKRRLVTFGGEILKSRKELELDDIEEGDLIGDDGDPVPSNDFEYVLYKWRMGCYVC